MVKKRLKSQHAVSEERIWNNIFQQAEFVAQNLFSSCAPSYNKASWTENPAGEDRKFTHGCAVCTSNELVYCKFIKITDFIALLYRNIRPLKRCNMLRDDNKRHHFDIIFCKNWNLEKMKNICGTRGFWCCEKKSLSSRNLLSSQHVIPVQ